MKNIFLTILSVLFLYSCGDSSVFNGKRVTSLEVQYSDTVSTKIDLSYDNEGRLSNFVQTKKRGDNIQTFVIDSIRYKGDSVIMYDRNDNRIFLYKLEKGYALNSYIDSDRDGYYSASFHYMGGHLLGINETRALSFSNAPDTICKIEYDGKFGVTSFKNKYFSYEVMPSEKKNDNSLLLPPIDLGDYTPAYYAGLLGKTTKSFVDSSVLSGVKTMYKYTESQNSVIVELSNDKGEKTTYKYSLK